METYRIIGGWNALGVHAFLTQVGISDSRTVPRRYTEYTLAAGGNVRLSLDVAGGSDGEEIFSVRINNAVPVAVAQYIRIFVESCNKQARDSEAKSLSQRRISLS